MTADDLQPGTIPHAAVRRLRLLAPNEELSTAAAPVLSPKPASSPKSHPTHGFSYTPEYRAWQAMRKRCTDPENEAWPDYGGRGITVCERWINDVATFIEDMGPKPSPEHELDREDNSKGYEPENCRWVLRKVNSRNRRSNRIVEWNGQARTMAEWCEITGLAFSTLKSRIDVLGWPVEKALTQGTLLSPVDYLDVLRAKEVPV